MPQTVHLRCELRYRLQFRRTRQTCGPQFCRSCGSPGRMSAVGKSASRRFAELLGNFIYLLDTCCANRVPAGFESPARIDRNPSTKCCLPIRSEFPCFAFSAESKVFNCTYLCSRETVMDFHHIDILMGKLRHPERSLACCNGSIEG